MAGRGIDPMYAITWINAAVIAGPLKLQDKRQGLDRQRAAACRTNAASARQADVRARARQSDAEGARGHCQLSGFSTPSSGPARLERGSIIGEQRSSPHPSCRATDTTSIPRQLKLTMPLQAIDSDQGIPPPCGSVFIAHFPGRTFYLRECLCTRMPLFWPAFF